MEHTQIVTASDLERYADTRDSESVIPELLWTLINDSVDDLTTCRIPYGDGVNQQGWDGLVETERGFHQFVPRSKSYWETGTGHPPQTKATKDFRKRLEKLGLPQRAEATFIFATPCNWAEPAQRKWILARSTSGWGAIKILDSVLLADWLRQFPVTGRWLRKKMGLASSISGFRTPSEHWENLQAFNRKGDPSLPPKLFLVGRDQGCLELKRLFSNQIDQLVLSAETEVDADDFVAAFLASLDDQARRSFGSRCIFVTDEDAWHSIVGLKLRHVLVAHPTLDLEGSGERLHAEARKNGHAVILCRSGAGPTDSAAIIAIRSPAESSIEASLVEGGYAPERARELAGAGTRSLAGLKRYLRGLSSLPPYATWDSARALALAGLLGKWNGENPADQAAAELLLGNSYGEWIEIVRPEALRSDTPLTQRNENWRVISRGEAWSGLGPRLFNEDLDHFQSAALVVLGERDPALELPKEQRFAASVHGKALAHSPSLRSGIAETLALLGSKPNALSSCSQGRAELIASRTVHTLLENADWMTWASLDRQLPLLAEAAPGAFLDAVERDLLEPGKGPFTAVFAQEGSGVFGRNHMTGLLWALESLAWSPDYLVRVTIVLGELASIDPGGNWANRPANSLANIFLPWHPQTSAVIAQRKAAVETLLHDQPGVGWSLLLSSLPGRHSISVGCHKPTWRDFVPPDWAERVTRLQYNEQLAGYADLAVAVAAADLPRLAELIDRLPDLPDPANARVIEHLASTTVRSLSEQARLPLWEALLDLAAKHRKFADAEWSMPASAVTKLEEVASRLAPSSPALIHRRLFSDRDLDLYEEMGNYDEQQQQLTARRQSAVQSILEENGLPGVLDFATSVASPAKVGIALGFVESKAVDAALLPKYLGSIDKAAAAIVGGFVWGRFFAATWSWADEIVSDSWTVRQKASFFSLLPFEHGTWQRAEKWLGSDAYEYWKIANVNPWRRQEQLPEVVDKLLINGRPIAALSCLGRLVHDKTSFSSFLAIRTLRDCLTADEKTNALDQHAVLELIEWLQDQPRVEFDALFEIEWAYLPLLGHQSGYSPRTLENRLASDPAFFCEVVSLVFRSDRDSKNATQPSEKQRRIAQNAYRLLDVWTIVPGSVAGEQFDGTAFGRWLADVRQRSKETGHFRMAMHQVGQVLPFSPVDVDGLWIHRAVADALNAKDAAEMRSGFTIRLFNMRGVHCFSGGREEQRIAVQTREKAAALERGGFHRFATAMRKFAESQERDAERLAQRDILND